MLRRRSYILNLAKLAPALALASLFGIGCVDGAMNAESDDGLSGIDLPSDMDSLDADTVAAEALHMRRVFDSSRAGDRLGFMKLDLADDMQYRYIVHRMALSGKSPENSPRLFEGIKKMRAAHLARPKVEVAPGDEAIGTTQQALESDDPCGLFLETPVVSTTTSSTVTSQSHVNCFGGTAFPYGYTDVATYETDAAESYLTPLGYTSTETYNGADDFSTSALAASLAVNIGKIHFVDGISYTEDSSGNSYSTYSYYKVMAKNKAASLSVAHPYDVNGDGVIRNCVKRGAYVGNGDCDYAATDASGVPSQSAVGVAKMVQVSGQWRAASEANNRWYPTAGIAQFQDLYLPLDGTFDAGSNSLGDCAITGFEALGTKAVMTLKGGGWCIGGQTGSAQNMQPFKDELEAHKSGRLSSFHMLANFGRDCLNLATGSANTVPVKVSIQVKAITSCGSDSGNANKPILNIDYKDSCFAKGTGILRADGKHIAVEEMKIGELVQSTQSGTPLTVVSISRGGEGKPLVQLLDSSGHSVLLTEKHPVITSAGVLPADQVKVGDQIESESGPAKVVGVERVAYNDAVYNLTLGTPEELSRVSADDRTMYAGGIRVGDNAMQFDLQKSAVAAPRGVAPEWRKDYDAAVARKANLHTPE